MARKVDNSARESIAKKGSRKSKTPKPTINKQADKLLDDELGIEKRLAELAAEARYANERIDLEKIDHERKALKDLRAQVDARKEREIAEGIKAKLEERANREAAAQGPVDLLNDPFAEAEIEEGEDPDLN